MKDGTFIEGLHRLGQIVLVKLVFVICCNYYGLGSSIGAT